MIENEGQVVIQVGVIEGSLHREVVVSFSTSDDTAIGKLVNYAYYSIAIIYSLTDGNDYNSITNLLLTFDSVTTNNVTVTIIGDTIFELTESFNAFLSFPGAPVPRVTLAPDSAQTTIIDDDGWCSLCLLYTSPSPRDATLSRMPSSA